MSEPATCYLKKTSPVFGLTKVVAKENAEGEETI
jgi:hypothetical protein